MNQFDAYTPSALRTLSNLEQDYRNWLADTRFLSSGRLDWKTRNGTDYLYRISGKVEHSLGARSLQTEAAHEAYQQSKQRRIHVENRLRMSAALCRTQGLPVLPSFVGKALRQLDVDDELGEQGVVVVGTHALVAYEQLAQQTLDQDLSSTQDLDFAWFRTQPYYGRPLLDSLKRNDATWTVNSERPFQLINARGDEIELLVAPSRQAGFPRTGLLPVNLPEQDWLLLHAPVEQIVPTQDRHAARMFAPDPRLFALHKLFISRSPKRNPLKVRKDEAQARAVLGLMETGLSHFPLSDEFAATLPPALRQILDEWREEKTRRVAPPPRPI